MAKVSGRIEKAFGKPLSHWNKQPIEFEVDYDEVDSFANIPDDEKLSESDILEVVNGKRKMNARSAETQRLLKVNGITKPSLENDPAAQRKMFIDALVANGYDLATASQVADNTLKQVSAQ